MSKTESNVTGYVAQEEWDRLHGSQYEAEEKLHESEEERKMNYVEAMRDDVGLTCRCEDRPCCGH